MPTKPASYLSNMSSSSRISSSRLPAWMGFVPSYLVILTVYFYHRQGCVNAILATQQACLVVSLFGAYVVAAGIVVKIVTGDRGVSF